MLPSENIIESEGTFLYTTQPAPIMLLSPIVTPFKIVTLLAIQQLLPIITGAVLNP